MNHAQKLRMDKERCNTYTSSKGFFFFFAGELRGGEEDGHSAILVIFCKLFPYHSTVQLKRMLDICPNFQTYIFPNTRI